MRIAIDKELLDYMTLKLTPDEKKQIENDTLSSGLLSWWRSRAAAFAILARVVRCVLAYPAVSAKSECNFSDASNTLTHKRNQLSPNTVDTLLFMRSNIAKWTGWPRLVTLEKLRLAVGSAKCPRGRAHHWFQV
ncbi:unnamed protein product [Sphagnum tenellum]